MADVKDTDPVTGNAVRSEALTNYLNTQADIIASRAVALKVVERLRLAEDRSLQRMFQEHAGACRLPSYVVLPFEPDVFLRKSVAGVPSGDWETRFWRIWNRIPAEHREVMPVSDGDNPYAACNRRQLEVASQHADEVAVIALFDGGADGAGGTADLIERARAAGGRIEVIDARKLLARSTTVVGGETGERSHGLARGRR